jgi:hypothetical protein
MSSEKTKPKQPRGNPRIAELGRATRFRPGHSGNPGGKPSWTPYADAHREVAELPVAELAILPTDSVAMATAKTVATQALKGNITAAAEAANRAEGTPRQRPELQKEIVVRVEYAKHEIPKRDAPQFIDLGPPSDEDCKPK